MIPFISPRLRKPLGIALAGALFAAAWCRVYRNPAAAARPGTTTRTGSRELHARGLGGRDYSIPGLRIGPRSAGPPGAPASSAATGSHHPCYRYRRRSRRSRLTPRQNDLLRLLAAGRTNAQIARRLGSSEGTVRTHLENIDERLGVSSRTAAVTRAFPGQVA
jgi:DNA-binding CsgD family transcriptional regulator